MFLFVRFIANDPYSLSRNEEGEEDMLKKIPLGDAVVLAARISSASKNPMELHGISLDILQREFFDLVYTDENECTKNRGDL